MEVLSPSFFRTRWNSALHGNQAGNISIASISVDLDAATAGHISMCTVERLLLSRLCPSISIARVDGFGTASLGPTSTKFPYD